MGKLNDRRFAERYRVRLIGTPLLHPVASHSIQGTFQHRLCTSGTRSPSSTSALSSALPFKSYKPLHASTCVGRQFAITSNLPRLGCSITATILHSRLVFVMIKFTYASRKASRSSELASPALSSLTKNVPHVVRDNRSPPLPPPAPSAPKSNTPARKSSTMPNARRTAEKCSSLTVGQSTSPTRRLGLPSEATIATTCSAATRGTASVDGTAVARSGTRDSIGSRARRYTRGDTRHFVPGASHRRAARNMPGSLLQCTKTRRAPVTRISPRRNARGAFRAGNPVPTRRAHRRHRFAPSFVPRRRRCSVSRAPQSTWKGPAHFPSRCRENGRRISRMPSTGTEPEGPSPRDRTRWCVGISLTQQPPPRVSLYATPPNRRATMLSFLCAGDASI